MLVTDIERNDVDFIARTLCLKPVAHIDNFTSDKLGTKSVIAEEVNVGGGQMAKVVRLLNSKPRDQDEYDEINIESSSTGTISILLRGSNQLVLDEAERSLHDALCVVRSLVKRRAIIYGGSAPEMEISHKLRE